MNSSCWWESEQAETKSAGKPKVLTVMMTMIMNDDNDDSDDDHDIIIMMMHLQPVMKNNSINQSASFKKVMYSVMGETEF